MLKLSLFPREKKFFILFQQGAQNAVKVAREFRDMMYTWENVKERVSIISDLEQDGDAITHEIMAQLYRSFVTPFDREDISALANSLDDVTDRIHSAADTMFLYRIERPMEQAKELADIILQTVVEVEHAVSQISGRIDQTQLLKCCVEINRLENLGDRMYHAALTELFTDLKDIAYVIKWREIYEDMESTLDGCEQVANVLEGVALKYA